MGKKMNHGKQKWLPDGHEKIQMKIKNRPLAKDFKDTLGTRQKLHQLINGEKIKVVHLYFLYLSKVSFVFETCGQKPKLNTRDFLRAQSF